jgi:arylsulfatase A-like enzyme
MQIVTRPLRCAAVCLILFVAPVALADEDRPPNVVVFLVDDLGYADIGCFGSSFYETPHIDRLASEGMRLTNAYAACPVCSPTRAALMTGKYPQRLAITDFINPGRGNQPEKWKRNTFYLPAAYEDRLPHDATTIAESLSTAGYATFFAGKWHLGPREFWPTDHGFDFNVGGWEAGHPSSYFSPYKNPQLPNGPEGEHLPDRLATETIDFITTHRDRPFLAYLSFYSVHTPLMTTDELKDKYEARAANLPKASFGREHSNRVRQDQTRAVYAGMVESMDNAVGRVLAKLKELGIAENTLVVFTSDNGGLSTSEGSPTSNRPLRAGKGWAYEGGIRVPTIVRWPGVISAGGTSAKPVISMDFYTTIRAAAGVPVKDDEVVDGVDLAPLLRGESIADRALYWDYPHYSNQGTHPVKAMREGPWKLVKYYQPTEAVELYNLDSDMSEQHNLAESEPDRVQHMTLALESWRKEVGSRSPTVNPRFQDAAAAN